MGNFLANVFIITIAVIFISGIFGLVFTAIFNKDKRQEPDFTIKIAGEDKYATKEEVEEMREVIMYLGRENQKMKSQIEKLNLYLYKAMDDERE